MPLRLEIDVIRFRAQPRGAGALACASAALLFLSVATLYLAADALSFQAPTPDHLSHCRSSPEACARNDRLAEKHPELAPTLPDGSPFPVWNPFHEHRSAVLCERFLADEEGFDPTAPWLFRDPNDDYVGWDHPEGLTLEPATRAAFLAMVQDTIALDPPDPRGKIVFEAAPDPAPSRRAADPNSPGAQTDANLPTRFTLDVPCRTPYRVASVEGWLLEELRTMAIRDRAEQAIATFHATDRSTVISHRVGTVLLLGLLPALLVASVVLGVLAVRRRRALIVELHAGRVQFAGTTLAREQIETLRMDGPRLELVRTDGGVLRSAPLPSTDVGDADALCEAFAQLSEGEAGSEEAMEQLYVLLRARRERGEQG